MLNFILLKTWIEEGKVTEDKRFLSSVNERTICLKLFLKLYKSLLYAKMT